MKNLLLVIIVCMVCACGNSHDRVAASGDISGEFQSFNEIPSANLPSPDDATNAEEITKKVIKTGGVDFQSENIEEDYKKIRNLLPRFNAYIENENQSKSTHEIRYNVTVRVPSTSYDTLYSSIAANVFRLDNRYSNTEDVTERYYDLRTRIKSKEALEQKYMELLEKASAIKDILEIEKNLNEVRTDIERLQGQFNYLSKQVNYSTIHLSFYEVLPYVYDSSQRKGFGARILSAIDDGWQGFLFFLLGLTSLWPFVILTAVIVFLFRKMRRRMKKKSV
ncbi:archaellum component FlaC [Algoriphagus sp. 4150]|uniref:DUF4349 domain-containing protein n=1 Tax=Algoriphagus sp. 4150 TaxID=2817756 RepID=UPI002859A465|nr:DUF4349 domain-containing protein [Algoriphagus sp. 4150]MDR7127916.1 archaellum component FlaC [Algoriphagus sp. 4150]